MSRSASAFFSFIPKRLSQMSVLAFCSTSLLVACPTPENDNPVQDAGITPIENTDPCALLDDCPDDGRPPLRTEMTALWDEDQNRMILFGGNSAISEQCSFASPAASDFHNDTWAFHARCGTWEKLSNEGPTPRARFMMAKDVANNRLLMFGGRYRQNSGGNYTLFNDLWAFDLAANSWSEITSSNAPSARVNSGFTINKTGTKAYLFAGNTSPNGASYNAQNDLWELDLTSMAWTKLTPSGNAPSPRLFVSMLYDETRDRLIMMHGGDNNAFSNTATYFDDVWAYNISSNAWELLSPGDDPLGPEGRFWGTLAYDSENDLFLSFGGHNDGALGNGNDLWSFDPISNEWTLLTFGDVYNKPANGQCDFPPDFSIVDKQAPERRSAHAMVYASGQCPSLIVAMGKTDCGAVDDVFRWNIAEQQWQEIQGAQQGEVCLRTDTEFDCTEMCN